MEIVASPESLARYRQLRARRDELRRRRDERHRQRWYCDRPSCNGEPHDGFHWCSHPIDSDEHSWECRHARADQHPPAEFVNRLAQIWLVLAGRGYGKTRIGAEWLADQAKKHPGSEWAVVAPTTTDVRETCFEGKSGLLRVLGMRREDPRYDKTNLLVRVDGGSLIKSFSAEVPARVHGPNLQGAWLDEIAKWKSRDMWDSLSFAIRHGDAQTVATSTPAAVPLVKEFVGRTDGSVAITRGTTFDNEVNLAKSFISEMRVRWRGTRRERQELYGELLKDVPGALWSAAAIERTRAILVG